MGLYKRLRKACFLFIHVDIGRQKNCLFIGFAKSSREGINDFYYMICCLSGIEKNKISLSE